MQKTWSSLGVLLPSIARAFIIALLIRKGFLVPIRTRTELNHSNMGLSMAGYLAVFLIILECFELLLVEYVP